MVEVVGVLTPHASTRRKHETKNYAPKSTKGITLFPNFPPEKI